MPQDEPLDPSKPTSSNKAVPDVLKLLGAHLKANPEPLLSSIDLLRERPFLEGEVSLKGGYISREEAARKERLREYLRRRRPNQANSVMSAMKTLAVCLLGACVWLLILTLLPSKMGLKKPVPSEPRQASPLETLNDVIEVFQESTPAAVARSGPRVLALAFSLAGLGTCIWLLFFFELPAHDPDPLFDRMIQERSPSPVSPLALANILDDPRFRAVMNRALDTIFPLAHLSSAEFKEIAYGHGYHLVAGLDAYGIRLNLSGPITFRIILRNDVDQFIDRLIDHLDPEGQCSRFFTNHSIDTLKQADDILYDHLGHEMREMLFSEIFVDPAFIYIYKRNQPKWRRVMAFLSAFDFERARKLFGLDKEKTHTEKPDRLQTAINASVVIGIVILLTHLYERPDAGTKCKECDKQVIVKVEDPKSSEDWKAWQQSLIELQGKFADLLSQIHCPPPSQPDPQPAKVVVNVPSTPAPVVTVPVTMPEIKIPSNIGVTVTTKADPTKTDPAKAAPTVVKIDGLEPALTLVANTVENHYKQPTRQIGGDDFATFTYTSSGAPGSNKPYTSNETSLVVHNGKLACTYKARIAAESLFPPDPVTIAIVAADPANDKQCTPTNNFLQGHSSASSTLVTAVTNPSYSELLHSYVSVEASHRYHLPPFHPKNFVLKIHYESEPHP